MRATSELFGAALLLLMFVQSSLLASFDTQKGARPLGLAGAFVAIADNPDAVYYNAAGLWQINQWSAQAFYSAPFNMRDLSTISFVMAFPWKRGTAGAMFESYGFDLYRETTLSVSYAYAFRNRFAAGVSVNYYHLSIHSGGQAGIAGASVGALFRPHSLVQIGCQARNITRPRIAGEVLPQSMVFGVGIMPSEQVTIGLDAYKDFRFPTDVRGGVEYRPHPALALRVGVGRDPSRLSAGLGIHLKLARLDYAIYTHPELGVTHAISAGITLNKRESRRLEPVGNKSR